MSPLIFRVKALRHKKGLTQVELAEAAEISPVTLIRLENNVSRRVDVDTLDKLSIALGVQPGDLFLRVRTR